MHPEVRALTWLFVPADRPDRVRKALASTADVVIVDLEDAVAPASKEAAREEARRILTGDEARTRVANAAVRIRVNSTRTPWGDDDLDLLHTLPPGIGPVVPKAEDPDRVVELVRSLPGRSVSLLIESAFGVEQSADLARCIDRIAWIALGEVDLRTDLGLPNSSDDRGLEFARSRIVNAAAAAGLRQPPMSVYPRVGDPDGLRQFSTSGRLLGFIGGLAIHPNQLKIIADCHRPSEEDLARARTIIAAADHAAKSGTGAVVLPDGTFVDLAVTTRAARMLSAWADEINSDRGEARPRGPAPL